MLVRRRVESRKNVIKREFSGAWDSRNGSVSKQRTKGKHGDGSARSSRKEGVLGTGGIPRLPEEGRHGELGKYAMNLMPDEDNEIFGAW